MRHPTPIDERCSMNPGPPPLFRDPRLYQILVLASLLVYGIVRLDLEIRPGRALLLLATALLTQLACTRVWRLPAFDPRSALISGLSLCLLLRTNSAALAKKVQGFKIHPLNRQLFAGVTVQ